MNYIDAIIHIADLPVLTAAMIAAAPGLVEDAAGRLASDPAFDATSARIVGFNSTPALHAPPAALVYVRVTPEDAATWRNAAQVTVLAEASYQGVPRSRSLITAIDGQDPITGAAANPRPDVVVDANAKALYAAIYDRSPRMIEDGNGLTLQWTPPALFGQIG